MPILPHLPEQTFEPFAIFDVAGEIGSDAKTINVDALDISPRVIRHLSKIVEAAKKGDTPYLFMGRTMEKGTDIPFGGNMPGCTRETMEGPDDGAVRQVIKIPADIVKRIHPIHGDIITDRVADPESYDMVVMMNTFLYFSDVEGMMALENISRMLKKDGILITDVEEDYIKRSDKCKSLPGINLRQAAVIPSILNPSSRPMVVWKKL